MKRKLLSIVFITSLILFAGCIKDKFIEPTIIPNPTVTDIDGNVYQTVTIGTQVWMVENLKVVRYRNGDPIPNVTVDTIWNHLTSGAYCNYENDTSTGNTCGHLYNWYAVGDKRNIAPAGWHVPTKAEWTILAEYLGGSNIAGAKMKEVGLAHWSSPNKGATNESGFSALPCGALANAFGDIGNTANWWTATDWSSTGAYYWWASYNNTLSDWNSCVKSWGCSVRCVKD